MSMWDVVVGGGLTLAGTVVTQTVAARIATKSRRAERRAASDEYDRTAIALVQDAAKDYRSALVRYNTPVISGEVDPDAESELKAARMGFQAVLHRAPPKVVARLERWLAVALKWSQEEQSAETEAATWDAAMKACGAAVRSTLSSRK
ncbi:hypothetical protein [Allobranchiibius sp. GilTou38]|uniref:hypothetical protein n=1 Tax=Allobranchiibius sp. GilTou38 TaxID=2815210 RepID=UPI001AA1CD36|nr:hypothetical protein [Allobranchiibius sp. GilTou38]MBO1767061.1 hypothetical protein [Allobranchiibius sp. GilTou38]